MSFKMYQLSQFYPSGLSFHNEDSIREKPPKPPEEVSQRTRTI